MESIKNICSSCIHTNLSYKNAIQEYLKIDNFNTLYDSNISKLSCKIACNMKIREIVINTIKILVKGKRVIIEGRNLGTKVFPKADVKFYMDSALPIRVKRIKSNESLHEIEIRDKQDTERSNNPLAIPNDANIIDNNQRTKTEVMKEMIIVIVDNLSGHYNHTN